MTKTPKQALTIAHLTEFLNWMVLPEWTPYLNKLQFHRPTYLYVGRDKLTHRPAALKPGEFLITVGKANNPKDRDPEDKVELIGIVELPGAPITIAVERRILNGPAYGDQKRGEIIARSEELPSPTEWLVSTCESYNRLADRLNSFCEGKPLPFFEDLGRPGQDSRLQ